MWKHNVKKKEVSTNNNSVIQIIAMNGNGGWSLQIQVHGNLQGEMHQNWILQTTNIYLFLSLTSW